MKKNNLKKILCALICIAMLGVLQVSAETHLEIPENATVIEISDENFEEYFEDITVIGEQEVDERRMGTVPEGMADNITCKAEGFIDRNSRDTIDLSYAHLNETNQLWLISTGGTKQIAPLNEGPHLQATGIYDETNNVLYYSSTAYTQGYAFSNFRENGLVTVSKFEATFFEFSMSSGTSAKYKITRMTARLKKLPYVTVSYNNELISFDQKPVVESGRTLVPLRAIFEKIGAEVAWNEDTQTVSATKDDTSISLTINNTEATKNGQPVALDVPAKVVNGRTLVPVRFVADCFGVGVEWNEDLQRVILSKK